MGTHPANFNRAVGLEAVKKQIAHDFSKWAANINLIGYQTAKMLQIMQSLPISSGG